MNLQERERVVLASKVIPSYIGGLGAYQRLLADELSERHVLFEMMVGESLPKGVAETENVWASAHLLFPPADRFSSLVNALSKRLASRPWLHGAMELLQEKICATRLVRDVFRRARVVHFVGTGWELLGFGLGRLAKRLGVTFTVLPAVHPGSWGDDAIDMRLYRQADSVFCLSDSEARHLIGRGLEARKVVRCVLPPMCRKDGDGLRLRWTLELGDRPAVLFVARRDAGKGYPALLEAWPHVLTRIPDAVLLLAGPGSPDARRLATIPTGSFRDLGVPDERTKADVLAACDVFCLPSAHESFGIVYLEAWSYGKPVICGSAPASRELVENEVNGFWSGQNPIDLASCLVGILSDLQRARIMGRSGRDLQLRTFTSENMLQAHLKAWKALPHQVLTSRV